jgi:hypothetical protein
VNRGEARSATDLVEGNLEVALREPHDVADATTARTIGDEDPLTRFEATHARVMRRLLPKSDRRPGRERLVTAIESG